MKRPVSCEWNITNYCNLKCSFCSMNSTHHKDFENLNITKIKEVARKIKEVGCIYVSLSGGEPMSHPLFFNIIKELRKKKLEVTITTNGTFINPSNIKKLEKLGIKWIQISLHGNDPDINNKIMGGNVYNVIRKSIELVKHSSIGISVSSVITNENKASIRKLQEELKLKNITHITRKCMFVGRAALIKKELNIGRKFEIEKISKNCGLFFAIAVNGDIQPCGEFKVKLGNIFEDNLIDIWKNSPILRMCNKGSRCLAEIYENNKKFRTQINSMI
ncbi:radical SAM additional 4Fe4S-binding SPASM domain-containing protein [Marinitoga hydrogenitolerans DSM 16785]|uniref:Radical SAM additional 4Fe4S-binding SPASM domain-containing protein n=1 Tax=Marinitoga hydrogenitolerans (strain DSM 16785 / JCM 12826 / AT1271) TaxID=1122195 RepID=A0A1M5A1C9_MARH1|nr:radical SAM protein [Marinitoga hydrogenitolerans]SHF24150.1 radical SAM additional 4Fe4S-binding SPASM domain-containing protein [Marinitoga hydrogenitolerans DSM 16785]